MKRQRVVRGIDEANRLMAEGWKLVPRTFKVVEDPSIRRLIVYAVLEKDADEETPNI